MFPPNDSDWISYIQAADSNNVSPCWSDIVGDVQYPAAYYCLYPTIPTPTDISFRMRLNGNPLSNNPNVYKLKEFVWGVKITDETNAVVFTVFVNASGATYKLQVRNALSVLIYDVPITLNDPFQSSDNVRVVSAGAHFPCANPIIPDEDYFLDFTMPISAFGLFDFVSSTYRLCYFTSTQDNVINKEYVCGAIINPPSGTPVLCVTKQILSGPMTVCTNDTHAWFLLITINNCGTVPVNNVVLSDTLNGSMIFTAPPVFLPNAGVSYNTATRVVTWNVGTINAGIAAVLAIQLTGYFTAPGHYVMDSGTVNGTGLAQIRFADQGILAYAPNQLTAAKEILSGPLSVEKCQISTWTLRITVTNTAAMDIPNVEVSDLINCNFTIESLQLTPSTGTTVVDGKEIIWAIDNLSGNSSETLLITVIGFFSAEGHNVFDTGSIHNHCVDGVTFQDAGIDVLPVSITKDIKICGEIRDCKTCELLSGVSATVYNSHCKIVNSYLFDQYYELFLPAGTYSVLFEKEGYVRKFLSLILQSDMEITADINMAPKATVSFSETNDTSIDIFSGIVCEKIDAMIVYSNFVCLNSEAQVESVDDIIDDFSCSIICESKLHLALKLEKNVIYKLNQVKNFNYYTKTVPICFPLKHGNKCKKTKCLVKMKCTSHCKEANIVYNIAHMQFRGYLYTENDILVNGNV